MSKFEGMKLRVVGWMKYRKDEYFTAREIAHHLGTTEGMVTATCNELASIGAIDKQDNYYGLPKPK